MFGGRVLVPVSFYLVCDDGGFCSRAVKGGIGP